MYGTIRVHDVYFLRYSSAEDGEEYNSSNSNSWDDNNNVCFFCIDRVDLHETATKFKSRTIFQNTDWWACAVYRVSFYNRGVHVTNASQILCEKIVMKKYKVKS